METGEPDSDFLALLGESDDRPEDTESHSKDNYRVSEALPILLYAGALGDWIRAQRHDRHGEGTGGEYGLLRL